MHRTRVIVGRLISLLAVVLLLDGARLAAAQNATGAKRDEQTIRSLIQQENDGKRLIKYTDESIFVSGAYPRPAIGAKEREAMFRDVSSRRSNTRRQDEPVRLIVAKSRDIAYEFGNFKMSFDDPDKKKVSFSGSYLRVWRKSDGEWKVDALFAKPNPEGQ